MAKETFPIDWSKYELASSTSKESFTEAVLRLLNEFENIEESELLNLLYVDLLSDLKYGYKSIFNITEVFIDELAPLFNESSNVENKRIVLDYLEYLLRDFLRDNFKIFVYPYPFVYGYDRFNKDELEYTLYKKIGKLIEPEFLKLTNSKDYNQFLYYLFLFNDDIGYIIDVFNNLSKIYVDNDCIITVRLGVFLHAYRQKLNVATLQEKIVSRIEVQANASDILSYMFTNDNLDFLSLKAQLKTKDAIDTIWCNGFRPIICADALLLKSKNSMKEIFLSITDAYLFHKSIVETNDPEDIPDFPIHKYLMEDATAIIFQKYYGSNSPITPKDLSEFERWVFDILSKDLKIHTHSMLFCGILPDNVSAPKMEHIGDPYNCYV